MSRPNIRDNKPCPLCGAPVAPEHAPFCSRGCKDRDLLQWLGEGYRMPGRALEEEEFEGLDRDGARPL
ncbi:DNA gyrase inhibitor YacG [Sphingomonas quercus]|uniref:DNA gyrase inhibitor YacG n=1 Tax=Sphingomonas quercus TaxID=2842451 RepID=A0ABS6BH89_9SPHN|nr:DNA gyrase inhibitor YacG [Sphingomonas quercus]MBU3076957.1 DNA gyrase inhibitor YacG [Sphingomonas quercus]